MIPGNILVVDNEYKDVSDVIQSFERNGFPVIYLSSVPEENKCPANVRLLILDLDLGGLGGPPSEEDISQAVLVLRRIESRTKFYLVALWSRYIDEKEDWSERIKNTYKEETGNDFPAYFLKAFGKKIEQDKLLKEIEKWIAENPYAGTVFELEKIFEDAMDNTVTDIANSGGIDIILKSLKKEIGKTAIPRELSSLFGNILLRHSLTEGRLKKLPPLIDKVLRKQLSTGQTVLDWYAKFHNLQTYFRVDDKEPLWTGDIIMKKDSVDRFAIVINPACDFALNKIRLIKLVDALGFNSIDAYNQNDTEVPSVVEWIGKKDDKHKERGNLISDIINQNLPQNFNVLYFIEPTATFDDFFHLLLDFSKIYTFKAQYYSGGGIKVPRGWKRVCRMDSPYVEDLFQKYSSFTSRIGTPGLPSGIKRKEISRLKSNN